MKKHLLTTLFLIFSLVGLFSDKGVAQCAVPAGSISGASSVCPGSTTIISSSLSGVTYAWSNGATTPSTTVTSGTYVLTITDANGCTGSVSKTVGLYAVNSVLISGAGNVCPGFTTTLLASSGNKYIWSTGAITQSINSGSGTYSATVTNANGCTASATKTVSAFTVTPASITAPVDFCPGTVATLTSSLGSSYLWSNGFGSRTITTTAPGNYRVTVTDGNGCKATAVTTIATYFVSPASIVGANSVCPGRTTILDASSTGVAYLWSNASTSPTVNVGIGAYRVTVTDANGCKTTAAKTLTNFTVPPVSITSAATTVCPGALTSLTATAGVFYIWNTAETTQTINASSGTYRVTVTNANGCTASASKTIGSFSASVAISGTTTVCPGKTTVLTSSAASSYKWSTGAITQAATVGAGSYSVTATNANGCTSVANVTVTNNPTPIPSIGGGPSTLCQGTTATFVAAGGNTYAWNTGVTSASLVVTPNANVTYTVTAANSFGCTASTSVPVSVNPSPAPTVTVMGGLCNGSAATLSSSAAISYLWSTGETTSSIAVTTSGNYVVTITNPNGCTAKSNAIINASPIMTSITPSMRNMSATAGSSSLNVQSSSNCDWSAVSDQPWATITSASSGIGSGVISYSVIANGGSGSRTANITVNATNYSATHTIVQAGGCSFVISPSNASYTNAGGSGNTVAVTANSGSCNWVATSNDAWITITSGSSATGNGTVVYSVATYTGTSARTGSMTIAGNTFTVTQSGSCSYSISLPNKSFTNTAGSGSFNVTTSSPICSWTAVASQTWVNVVSGASGSGNGAVSYTVDANPGATRSAFITLTGDGGITILHTISQTQASSGCSYSLSSTSGSINKNGGTVNVGVNTGASCGWTSRSNASWITISAGASGIGPGTVSLSVGTNPYPSANRTGNVVIAGIIYSLTQTYSLREGVIETVIEAGREFSIGLAPNPASGNVNIQYVTPVSGTVHIQVMNMMGQTIMSLDSEAVAGENYKELDLSNLADGYYLIGVNDGTQTKTERLMIQK